MPELHAAAFRGQAYSLNSLCQITAIANTLLLFLEAMNTLVWLASDQDEQFGPAQFYVNVHANCPWQTVEVGSISQLN